MLKTTIIGYPRVGSQRELKFWTEDYFKGNILTETLKAHAADLRKKQWQFQRQKGVDLIPSNDFSFYDGMLDTIFLLGAIPQAYKDLGLGKLDTYFAMAHGYQGKNGDVRALSMRKWFNTNYHYMVPELDDNSDITVSSRKPFEEYSEALEIGIKTKPVLVGPFTFLMLADYKGNKHKSDYVSDIVKAYKNIFNEFKLLGCDWIQLDEPSLVTDLDKDDIDLFILIYKELLLSKGDLKILLQTYFGDIRDVYDKVISLPFDGIGLDFVEGKKTMGLILKYGFPKDTMLFAGIINGKNIWRNNYTKTLSIMHELKGYILTENIIISSSCSLLHVPYTIENEASMEEKYKRYFAFAQEKLEELSDLSSLLIDANYNENNIYKTNAALIESKMINMDIELRKKVSALTKNDFIRKPAFEERKNIQEEALHLPVLPVTTIGSFPQTPDVKALRAKLKKNEITFKDYKALIKKKIADCIALQEDIGLNVLVHGEYERNDMVEYFGENLNGFLFTQNAWVQSYGTRCVKPPIIWGDIRRNKPITVEYIAYAQSLTSKPVKGMLTGPVTILNWSFPREDISNREMAFQIALALKEEAADLESEGIRIIQIDEAALKEKLPLRRSDWHSDYLDWAIPAFRLVHCSVKPSTQIHTHMCYSEFNDIINEIDEMDADVISFEAARSHYSIVDVLAKAKFKTAVGPGVYDIHSPRVPTNEEIKSAILLMLKKISPKKLWVNPDCGLKTRGEKETNKSLRNMVAAANSIRNNIR
ncbi:MAG: 5-methyltetrahydropteroyltriglutamate--homocysteine S-methyltransferase [Eubacteriales bacterium]